MQRSASHLVLTILMDALVFLAVLITAGMVAAFFGALESTELGGILSDITTALTAPFGLPEWETPYAGVFRSDSGAMVVIVLGIEWFLSIARRRGSKS